MWRWICGILAFLLICTCCVNVVRKINGVDVPMHFTTILTYLGNQKHIDNTVADIIAEAETVLQIFPKTINGFQEFLKTADEYQEEMNAFEYAITQILDVIIAIFRDIVIGVEGIIVGLTLVIYSIPLFISIVREFVYLARIAAYVLFNVPLI